MAAFAAFITVWAAGFMPYRRSTTVVGDALHWTGLGCVLAAVYAIAESAAPDTWGPRLAIFVASVSVATYSGVIAYSHWVAARKPIPPDSQQGAARMTDFDIGPGLAANEQRIDALAARLDVPVDSMTWQQRAVLSMGLHGVALYRGIRRECMAGEPATAQIVHRVLMELAITLRWIKADPSLRVRLWLADDDRRRLLDEQHFLRAANLKGSGHERIFPPAEIQQIGRDIAEARADAGLGPKEPLLPPLEARIEPGDDVALQAYYGQYTTLNWNVHSRARAFVDHRQVNESDGTHIRASSIGEPALIRAWSTLTLAMALEAVSSVCTLGLEDEVQALRDGRV